MVLPEKSIDHRLEQQEGNVSKSALLFVLNWLATNHHDFRYIEFLDKENHLDHHTLDVNKPALPLTTITTEVTPSEKDITTTHIDPSPILFLTTGIGTSITTKDTQRAIAEKLHVSVNTIKAGKRNHQTSFNPQESLGLTPGIISPFIHKDFDRSTFAIWVIKDDQHIEDRQPVEIGISQNKSLFIYKEALHPLLITFENHFLRQSVFTPIAV